MCGWFVVSWLSSYCLRVFVRSFVCSFDSSVCHFHFIGFTSLGMALYFGYSIHNSAEREGNSEVSALQEEQ